MVSVCTVPARGGRSCERFGGYKTINRIPLLTCGGTPSIPLAYPRSLVTFSLALTATQMFALYALLEPIEQPTCIKHWTRWPWRLFPTK